MAQVIPVCSWVTHHICTFSLPVLLLIQQEERNNTPSAEVCQGHKPCDLAALYNQRQKILLHLASQGMCSSPVPVIRTLILPYLHLSMTILCWSAQCCPDPHRLPWVSATRPPSMVKLGRDRHKLDLSLLQLNEQAQPSEEVGKHGFLPDLSLFMHTPSLSPRKGCTGFSWSIHVSRVKYFRACRLWA